MKPNIDDFLIDFSETLLTAISKIEKIKKIFVVVHNRSIMVTLTDGDIRRAFIIGKYLDSTVEETCIRTFKSISVNNDGSNYLGEDDIHRYEDIYNRV